LEISPAVRNFAKKGGMARLEKAYSAAVCLAMPIDSNVVVLSAIFGALTLCVHQSETSRSLILVDWNQAPPLTILSET
jgi:hypothetical protein